MKKKIAFLLIAIILAISFFSTSILADTESETETSSGEDDIIINGSNPDNFNSAWEKGTVTTYGEEENKNASIEPGDKSNHTPLRLVGRALLLLPQLANEILSLITGNGKNTYTIRNTLTNKYDIFNIKYLIEPDSATSNNSIISSISNNIAIWFVGVRNLSAVIIAIILVYIGIRLALATVAEEKAEYKKMLMGWLEGIVLLFLLHYIIIIFIYLSDWMIRLLNNLMVKDSTSMKLEENILKNINENIFKTSSKWGWVLYGTFYILLTFSEVQIFIFYLYRLIKVAYLIIISPLVCVTYSIDKIKDGKAQAFENWIKEFAIAVLAQPLQLLIYVIFIDSAGEILYRNMFFAIIFFLLIPYGSRIFKSVLKFGEDSKDFENAGKFKSQLLK